ncbi:MAG TPA: hypothetical protein VKD28_03295 [Gemmatimonadales bacterium]|nr:hypothetical protein [Gemmatimonadales bacterium]
MLLPALFLLQATFQSPRVLESSGVAISRQYPGVVWTHNDSGDGPYLYATDLTGADRGFLLVSGADAFDWEDMALGVCPVPFHAVSCLYLADAGDNLGVRPFVTLYALPEPVPPDRPGDTLRITSAAAILRVSYPDGPKDVEAIFVSPRDTAAYLVSKGRGGSIKVYRVGSQAWNAAKSGATGDPVLATVVQTLDIRPSWEAGRVITGAAIRNDGRVVALRTYNEIYLFNPGVGGRLVPAREEPCNIGGIAVGGEAVAFLNDTTLVMTSEAGPGRPGRIDTIVCHR